MTPAQMAAEFAKTRGVSFQEEVEAHMLNGVCVAAPDLFLLARAVPKGALIRDVWETWPQEECDAWFVWLGIGSPRRMLESMPYILPWIGWNRAARGWSENRWAPTARLLKAFR